MRAVLYDTSGPQQGDLRVEELPDPEPAAGEVRVQVAVSGVNPTDWKARRAPKSQAYPRQVANQDGSGIIDRVGPGVPSRRVGERVWVYHAADRRPSGTAAEFVCLPEEQVVRLPDGSSFDQGAGLGIPAMTAHRCLFADGPLDGATVLVTGGAGAVGHAAIQLARWAGARVVATVSTTEKAELARGVGADAVLYYREPTFADELQAAVPDGIDRVVDVALATNLPTYLEHLNLHAAAASYASGGSPLTAEVSPLTRANVVLRFVHVYGVAQPDLDHAVRDITTALEAGAVQPLPGPHYPLERTADAHEASRSGVTGKVLIDVATL